MPLRTSKPSSNRSSFNDVPSSLNMETLSSELLSACSRREGMRSSLWESPEKKEKGLGGTWGCGGGGSVALGLNLRRSDVPLCLLSSG